jgi:hypothetical protein
MAIRKLINEASICTLARSYNILDYYQNLKAVLSHVYSHNLNNCPKQELHWLINELLLENYTGESTLKAKLTDLFIQKDVVAAFEIKVNNSRVDFLTINGESKSFEIKSELDNLYKLSKQVSDYEKVFDENYIVIDEKHFTKAKKLIPDHYGIIVLHGHQLINDKTASPNEKLDSEKQLRLFTKKELAQTFKIPDITTEEIQINYVPEEINERFKEMLKKRYTKRWQFLVDNKKQIYPIDYQFFFQHNIQPRIIYR